MPASGGDPVASALRLSLTASERTGDLDKRLVASSAKVLLSRVEYESSGSYKSTVLDNLKGKYIVLRTGGSIANGNACLKFPNKKVSDEMRPEPDAVLPAPKITLFPAEKVQLGWRGTFPVGAGMINVGNTCYLNSTLQALFHVPALVNWLQSDSAHLEKCALNGAIQSECIICALNKTLKTSHNKGTSIIKPILIYSKLKMICKHMNHGQQEDAHEFMRYLIESMEKAYLLRYKGCKLDNYSKETTPLNQIFGGYIRSEVTCLQCRAVSTTFQHFQDLLLDIRRASTVEDALSAYFTHERLEGDDAYRCERCHRKVPANKKFSLEKPPMVLCIQLKRFSMVGAKLNKHVLFPQRLDLTRYLCPQSQYRGGQPLTYRLTSLVLHMGSSVNCGHYTAVAQTSTGHWYQFDDSSVRPISLNTVLEMNAYIIIYEMDKSEANVPQIQSAVSTKPATVTSLTSQNILTNGNAGYKTNLQRLVSPAMIPTSVKAASHTNGLLNNHKPAVPVTSKVSPVKSPVKVMKPEIPVAVNSTSNLVSSPAKERTQSSQPPQNLTPYDPGDSTGTDSEPEGDDANRDSSPCDPGDDSSVPSPPSNSPTPPPLPVTTVSSSPAPAPSPGRKLYIPRANWQVTEQVVARATESGGCSKFPVPSHTSTPIPAATTTWRVSPLPPTGDSTPWSPQQPQRPGSVSSQSERQCNGNRSSSDDNHRLQRDDVRSIAAKDGANGENRSSPVNRGRIPHAVDFPVPRDERSPDSASRQSSNGKPPNQLWDGAARTEVASKLKYMSHQGYAGAQVSSWGGERSHVDIEVEKERDNEHKRSFDNLYDEELDRGRVKKMKFNNGSQHNSRPKYNSFQLYHNEKHHWSNSNGMYQQQDYYRPHHSHPHPPPYFHKGAYHKNRGVHSFHKFSGSGRFGKHSGSGRFNGSKQGVHWRR